MWTLLDSGWLADYFLPSLKTYMKPIPELFPVDPDQWSACVRGNGNEEQSWTSARDVWLEQSWSCAKQAIGSAARRIAALRLAAVSDGETSDIFRTKSPMWLPSRIR